jgi:hypothetical protein
MGGILTNQDIVHSYGRMGCVGIETSPRRKEMKSSIEYK